MSSPEKNQLSAEAMQCWADFQERLSSGKQKYPVEEFRAFWAVTKRYAELTRSDPLIHAYPRHSGSLASVPPSSLSQFCAQWKQGRRFSRVIALRAAWAQERGPACEVILHDVA